MSWGIQKFLLLNRNDSNEMKAGCWSACHHSPNLWTQTFPALCWALGKLHNYLYVTRTTQMVRYVYIGVLTVIGQWWHWYTSVVKKCKRFVGLTCQFLLLSFHSFTSTLKQLLWRNHRAVHLKFWTSCWLVVFSLRQPGFHDCWPGIQLRPLCPGCHLLGHCTATKARMSNWRYNSFKIHLLLLFLTLFFSLSLFQFTISHFWCLWLLLPYAGAYKDPKFHYANFSTFESSNDLCGTEPSRPSSNRQTIAFDEILIQEEPKVLFLSSVKDPCHKMEQSLGTLPQAHCQVTWWGKSS